MDLSKFGLEGVDLNDIVAAASKIDSEGITSKDEKTTGGFNSAFLDIGLHEGVDVKIYIREDDEGAPLTCKKDPTFLSLSVVFSKDGKSKTEYYSLPTIKLTYGVNNIAFMYTNLKKLLAAVYPPLASCDSSTLKKVFKLIESSKGGIIADATADITIGFGNKSHVKFIQSGVYRINEFNAASRNFEELDIDFPSADAAMLYAEDQGIALEKFPKVQKIVSNINSTIPEEVLKIFKKIGVLPTEEGESIDDLPHKKEETKKTKSLF
jgi:hypothetical protein